MQENWYWLRFGKTLALTLFLFCISIALNTSQLILHTLNFAVQTCQILSSTLQNTHLISEINKLILHTFNFAAQTFSDSFNLSAYLFDLWNMQSYSAYFELCSANFMVLLSSTPATNTSQNKKWILHTLAFVVQIFQILFMKCNSCIRLDGNKTSMFFLVHSKIQNISTGLIDIFKHIFGGFYSKGLIFEGYFVFVSAYQDLKIYKYRYFRQKHQSLGKSPLFCF